MRERLIEVPLHHGEALFARGASGAMVPCSRHPSLPRVHVLDLDRLPAGERYRYLIRRPDGPEVEERYFSHSPDRGGPIDVWDGIRAIESPSFVREVEERFRRQGYAVIEDVISSGVVAEIDAIVRPLAERAWGRGGAQCRDKINLEKVLIAVPYLLQALIEKLGPVLTAIVGPRVWLDYEQVMVIHSNTNYLTRRHRDIDGGREAMSESSRRDRGAVHLWIPLVDVDATRSGMYVEPFGEEGNPRDIEMRAGDALLLHNFVWHGAHTNTSDVHRFSWLLNFAPHPSRDSSNPAADLELLTLLSGAVQDLGPDVCERRLLAKPAYLNLFDAYFTFDTGGDRMVNAANRGP